LDTGQGLALPLLYAARLPTELSKYAIDTLSINRRAE